jgi:hypothetical protein
MLLVELPKVSTVLTTLIQRGTSIRNRRKQEHRSETVANSSSMLYFFAHHTAQDHFTANITMLHFKSINNSEDQAAITAT